MMKALANDKFVRNDKIQKRTQNKIIQNEIIYNFIHSEIILKGVDHHKPWHAVIISQLRGSMSGQMRSV